MLLLLSTVSETCLFGTIDITDFYLGSPMPAPEFLKLPTSASDYEPELLDDLGITPYIKTDSTGKNIYVCLSLSSVHCLSVVVICAL
jgi:hypothetical protein